MIIQKTPLDGLMVITPKVFDDARGYFLESFNLRDLEEFDIPPIVQENEVGSRKNVLRGMHYQSAPNAQGKYIFVVHGTIQDITVDLRKDSPTFLKHFSVYLSDENRKRLWVPPGFAHGYLVTSEIAKVIYGCSKLYDPSSEHGLLWNDQELKLPWRIKNPILSDKDKNNPTLAFAIKQIQEYRN